MANTFKSVTEMVEKRRLIMAVGGQPKSGRTEFGMSAPYLPKAKRSGIYYHNLDMGIEGTIEKHKARLGKALQVANYLEDVQATLELQDPKEQQAKAKKLMTQFLENYEYGVEHGRTTVVDDATVLWDIWRLAEFGRLEQVPQLLYVSLNKKYRDMVMLACVADTNLILLHQVKEIWVSRPDPKDPAKTIREGSGRYELAGCDAAGKLIQVQAMTEKQRCQCLRQHAGPCLSKVCSCRKPCGQDGEFHFTVQLNRCDPSTEGLDFSSSFHVEGAEDPHGDILFGNIATFLVPETSLEDWE